MKFQIKNGVKRYPGKYVIYGPEGIGKSTLASKFPKPLFIDIENGTNQLDVNRIEPTPDTWDDLLGSIDYVLKNPKCCRTLVIDTMDAAERLCTTHVCKDYKIRDIEQPGFGKGYVYLETEYNKLLTKLDEVTKIGINVVCLAHSTMKKVEQPNQIGNYDHYELKMQRKLNALVKEWCDTLLFANYEVIVEKYDDGKARASGGERVIYTTHTPSWDAKNRYNLDEKLPMDFSSIKGTLFDAGPLDLDEMTNIEVDNDLFDDDPDFIDMALPDELAELMMKSKV